jgi:hypothetical protein
MWSWSRHVASLITKRQRVITLFVTIFQKPFCIGCHQKMNIFSKLNPWQRLWIVLSVIMFAILLTKWTNESRLGEVVASNDLRALLQPACRNLPTEMEGATRIKIYDKRDEFRKKGGRENQDCVYLLERAIHDGKIKTVEQTISEIQEYQHKHLISGLSYLITWLIIVALLYGIGILARWIRFGK